MLSFSNTKVSIKLYLKVILFFFAGVIIVLNILKKMPYESHYFEKLGVNRIGYKYIDMINDFGDPIKITTYDDKENWTEAIYDDFILSFWSNTPNSYLTNIRIISGRYRFGWRSIGIGSTKKEVESAYKHTLKSSDLGWAYIDGIVYIKFLFDNNDIVEEIMFYDYSHF